ncbi:hypothetical protein OH492_25385 [Vibrio chagasii]|nr:hypothetical protein [Vibrio chagasii]
MDVLLTTTWTQRSRAGRRDINGKPSWRTSQTAQRHDITVTINGNSTMRRSSNAATAWDAGEVTEDTSWSYIIGRHTDGRSRLSAGGAGLTAQTDTAGSYGTFNIENWRRVDVLPE